MMARSTFEVAHAGGKATFAFPEFGRGSYVGIGKKMRAEGLEVPTGDIMASLVEAAYIPDSKECGRDHFEPWDAARELHYKEFHRPDLERVRQIMEGFSCLYIFQRCLWTTHGVYVSQDLEAKGFSEPLVLSELERAISTGKKVAPGVIFSEDGKTRFACMGSYGTIGYHHFSSETQSYSTKCHVVGDEEVVWGAPLTSEDLANDGLVIASFGVEGAKKLSRVSSLFETYPRVFLDMAPLPGEPPVMTVEGIYRSNRISLSSGGTALHICTALGRVTKDAGSAFAFGVLPAPS